MQSSTFFERLPRRNIELVDGACLIGGSLQASRMVLASMLQTYGAEIVKPFLKPRLLAEALEKTDIESETKPAASYADEVPHIPLMLTSKLRGELYLLPLATMGRDQVIKIGENALTPEIFVYTNENDPRQYNFYFDGGPDLIIDLVHPATRDFDEKQRLRLYQESGAAEIWMIDFEKRHINTYSRASTVYKHTIFGPTEDIESSALPGITLHNGKLWDRHYHDSYFSYPKINSVGDLKWSNKPFPTENPTENEQDLALKIGLSFTPLNFDQFISWAPEAKFEWYEGKPSVGRSEEDTLKLAGLLLMTIGLEAAVQMLPADRWRELL
jgi:hypothetical protein